MLRPVLFTVLFAAILTAPAVGQSDEPEEPGVVVRTETASVLMDRLGPNMALLLHDLDQGNEISLALSRVGLAYPDLISNAISSSI